MNTPDKRTPFEQQARALYLDAARDLDPAIAGRLRAARREALAVIDQPSSHRTARWLIPSGACAAIALAAVLAWPSLPRHVPVAPAATASATAGADSEQLLPPDPEQADPNLYQNLDFYGWLAANDRSPPANH